MDEKDFNERLNALHDRVLSKMITNEEENSYTESLFESIKNVNEYGQEFWYARELQVALEYTEWRNFKKVIDKAILSCKSSNNDHLSHFVEVNKMVNTRSVAGREIEDYKLSRYACYIIVQNGDPRKKVIALGQSYFAIKTRQQELIEHYESLDDNQKRLAIRRQMAEHNKQLVAAAKEAGVESTMDYAIFQNFGYMGLYGGLDAKAIHEKKGLKKSQKILDHMGYEELAANLFRATQTEAKLRRENVQGKAKANDTHLSVGKEVRETIKRIGGTMPENLPTPNKSIKELEREEKKNLK